jgi:hypothetical protein
VPSYAGRPDILCIPKNNDDMDSWTPMHTMHCIALI